MPVPHTDNRTPGGLKRLLRNFAIELVLYGTLVAVYVLLALRSLDFYLADLFNRSLTAYAFIGLFLVLAQGVVLDAITSFLLNQIKLDRFD